MRGARLRRRFRRVRRSLRRRQTRDDGVGRAACPASIRTTRGSRHDACERCDRLSTEEVLHMGQVNVNPPSGPVVVNDGGFGAGMIIGIILLILIVLVLIFVAGPHIFMSRTSPAPSPTVIPSPTKNCPDTL